MEIILKKRKELFDGHRKLACGIARSFFGRVNGRNIEAEDIIQEAYLFLWKATNEYNGNGKFSTFASWAIKNDLLNLFELKGMKLKIKVIELPDVGYTPNYDDLVLIQQLKVITERILSSGAHEGFWMEYYEYLHPRKWDKKTKDRIHKIGRVGLSKLQTFLAS